MKQTNNILVSQKIRIAPRLNESLAILSAPAYTLEKVLDDYSTNPFVEIISPFKHRSVAESNEIARARAIETTSLEMHLFEQISMLRCSEAERYALKLLVSLLDSKGFFTASPVTVAKKAGLTLARVQQLLRILQTFDPPGIGARNYRECMKIQLHNKGLLTRNATLIIDQFLPELADRSFEKIEATADIDTDESKALLTQIKKLRPCPAQSFTMSQPVVYIEPDIIVETTGEKIDVRLNPATIFRIRLHESSYYEMNRHLNPDEEKYLLSLHKEARWLKSSIRKRYDTLLAVAKTLCEQQRGYFLHGDQAMSPMTKESLARMLGLHPSTITRTLNEKYIKSSQGIQPASYLFSGRANIGGGYSPIQIKQLIRQLINRENEFFPESDEKITVYLNAAGIEISRRTVAKYRLSIGISPAHIRKKQM